MNQFRPGGFSILPPVVKNLLILNIVMYVVDFIAKSALQIDLGSYLGLHNMSSKNFMPVQFVSYMFMHGSFMHLFSNMFALWMFGNAVENVWGGKKFLIYYFVTGIGAGIIYLIVQKFQISEMYAVLPQEAIDLIKVEGPKVIRQGMNYSEPILQKYNSLFNGAMVGASGSVFGILLAFGMLFPNSLLYIYFAIPVRAKYFVMFYGAFELYTAIQNNPGDNVAHFAHLGGMLFGILLIYYWRKKGTYL